jgi:nucleotide-binding universal stress UspA family protein
MFYYYAFFTVLAFAPFVLNMSAHAVGLIYFGWGLLLAIFSVVVAPRLQARFSAIGLLSGCLALLAAVVLAMGFLPPLGVAAGVVASGALMGLANTVFTEMALEVSSEPRPVASAAYNCVRWFAGVVAPFSAPLLAETFGTDMAFIAAAVATLIAPVFLYARRRTLGHYGAAEPAILAEPEAEPAKAAPRVLAAVDGTPADAGVIEEAIHLARTKGGAVAVLHVFEEEILDGEAADSETLEEAEAILSRALAQLAAAGVPAEGEVMRASAAKTASAILAKARALPAEALVLGARHRRDPANLVHGSVADAIQRAAPALTVVMVAEPERKAG